MIFGLKFAFIFFFLLLFATHSDLDLERLGAYLVPAAWCLRLRCIGQENGLMRF